MKTTKRKRKYTHIGQTRVTVRQADIIGMIAVNPGITLRRLGEMAGIKSAHGVSRHLRALRKKGLVQWTDGKTGTLVATGGTA
jgi:DNA-binding MarR family transcriptional regulator